jgi:hypothetical protein
MTMTAATPHTTKTRRKRKAQSYNFDYITISDALKLLESVPRAKLGIDAKQYATGYLALRHLIRDNINFRNPQELLAASYAVLRLDANYFQEILKARCSVELHSSN